MVLLLSLGCVASDPDPAAVDVPPVDLPPAHEPVVAATAWPVGGVVRPDRCRPTAVVAPCPGRGMYPGPVDVELVPPHEGDVVSYSLDGGPEQIATGTVRIAPAPGQAVVVLRATAEGTPAVLHSYVFPGEAIRQPSDPPDRPDTWGISLTTPADYGMDPRVVDVDPAAAIAAFSALPAVSLVLAPDDLWGVDGIYMNPEDELERPGSLELLSPTESVQVDCGLRIQGGSSTLGWKSDKLSLRARFSKDFGPGKLEVPVFGDEGPDWFDTLILDAHLNLTFIHPDDAQRSRPQYVGDSVVSDLQNAVGSVASAHRFVHLFLGGLYWGVYDLHERPDASFAAARVGGDKDDWDALKHDGTLVDGDTAAWDALFAATRAGDLDGVAALLDVDDFVDYMLVNLYAGNTDWPHHNWYAARDRTGTAGFRFFSWDAEHVFKDLDQDSTGEDDTDGPGELYQALLTDPAFVDQLEQRAAELLTGPLSPTSAGATYGARADEVADAILLESARWGDNQRPEEPYTVDVWQTELDWLLGVYFPARSDVVLQQVSAL